MGLSGGKPSVIQSENPRGAGWCGGFSWFWRYDLKPSCLIIRGEGQWMKLNTIRGFPMVRNSKGMGKRHMKNRKLTSVEKKKFEEERARRILMLFFPEKYNESYLSDRPDIVNRRLGIGVEVTDSLLDSIQEKLSKAAPLSGKYGKDLERYLQENIIRRRVGSYTLPNGQVLSGFTFWGSTHDLIRAYERKHESMNKEGFQLFGENNLFIYAWLSDDKAISEFIAHMEKNGDGAPSEGSSGEDDETRQFDLVYVFLENRLLEVRRKDGLVTAFRIDTEELDRISDETFEKITGTKHQEVYGDGEPVDIGES
jgi:hypothetical protein